MPRSSLGFFRAEINARRGLWHDVDRRLRLSASCAGEHALVGYQPARKRTTRILICENVFLFVLAIHRAGTTFRFETRVPGRTYVPAALKGLSIFCRFRAATFFSFRSVALKIVTSSFHSSFRSASSTVIRLIRANAVRSSVKDLVPREPLLIPVEKRQDSFLARNKGPPFDRNVVNGNAT